MSLFIALLLGIFQGLTEFLPISSSTHLALAKMAFGVSTSSVLFDLSCHLGTLATLLWVLRKEWLSLFLSPRHFLSFFIALIPLIPAYFLFSPLRKSFSLDLLFLATSLAITSFFLFLGKHWRPTISSSRPLRDAFLIGSLQATALIPGVSRSASTISCAHILGWSSAQAVRFSFLLAIPTVLGGTLLEMYQVWKKETVGELFHMDCLVGGISSFITSMLVIRFAFALLEKGKLHWFGFYCGFLSLAIYLYRLL